MHTEGLGRAGEHVQVCAVSRVWESKLLHLLQGDIDMMERTVNPSLKDIHEQPAFEQAHKVRWNLSHNFYLNYEVLVSFSKFRFNSFKTYFVRLSMKYCIV